MQEAWLAVLDEMVKVGDAQAVKVAEEAGISFGMARMWLIGLGAIALALGIVAAIFITRSLVKQLGR